MLPVSNRQGVAVSKPGPHSADRHRLCSSRGAACVLCAERVRERPSRLKKGGVGTVACAQGVCHVLCVQVT